MIGSTQFGDSFSERLNTILEEWEDTLKSNHDDFVHVDGEEGDFGIISYFGADVNGNENVRLMVKYVNGGDIESTHYTEEGNHVVNFLMLAVLPSVLRRALTENVAPPEGMYKMKIGEIKAAKDADEKAKENAHTS